MFNKSFFSEDFLQFFIELAPNNHKDWFNLNRKRYEENIKKPFYTFTQHLINKIALKDSLFKDLLAKDCVFRINRDIRFSKDKSPYKLQCSAVIAPNGKKSQAVNGVYFEFGPEHVRIYGGIYEIEKNELTLIREGIANNLHEFQTIYNAKEFKAHFGRILGEKNKLLPSYLKESALKEPLIFNKQWYFFQEFPPETILDPHLDQIVLDCFEAGRPIEQFFNQLIKRS
jgi:uncharacterized protein (TIGR02453 family)